MTEKEVLQLDLDRVAKLKQVARAGIMDEQLSYFNDLILVHGNPGKSRTNRSFTERERERVDLFLRCFAP